MKIFISYSSKDEEQARELARKLRQENYECWISCENLNADHPVAIPQEIAQSDAVVMVISEHSKDAPGQETEMKLAEQEGVRKEIIPFLLESVEHKDTWLTWTLVGKQVICGYDQSGWTKLVERLEKLKTINKSDVITLDIPKLGKLPKLGKSSSVVGLTTLEDSLDIMHLNHALQFDRLLRPRRALEELCKISKQEDLIVRYFTLRIKYSLEGGVDESELENVFIKACELGCADAKAYLASKYLDDWDSKGSANISINQCMEWLKEAIIAGEPEALVGLADVFLEGKHGVSKDKSVAEALYKQAIDAGSLTGRIALGFFYYDDDVKIHIKAEDVLRPILLQHLLKYEADADKFVHWIIAITYFAGIVVQTDYSKAVVYFKKVLSSNGKIFSQEDLILSHTWDMLGTIYYSNGIFKNEQEAFRCFTNACKIGTRDGGAENKLGWCFENGIGVDKNELMAMEWYTRAANKGNASALFSLGQKNIESGKIDLGRDQLSRAIEKGDDDARLQMGLYLCEGKYFPSDLSRGVEYINISAENGNSEAMEQMGMILLCGLYGVEKDLKKAEEWLTRAAESGNASAECSLGTRYAEGNFGVVDNQKAFYWWKRAAEHSYVPAIFNMGEAYLSGIGVMADPRIACDWFKKAAELGNVKAMIRLGDIGLEDEWGMVDREQAEKWFLRAVETGDVDALNRYAVLLYNGTFGDADKVKAIEVWTRAADKGCSAAMVSIGECYRDGDGVPVDANKAVQWFERAIELKNTEAMKYLAEIYLKGEVVVYDSNKTKQLLTEAFDLGDEEAAILLADHYRKGSFGKKDCKKAIEYYNFASKKGNAMAQLSLGIMYCRREFSDGEIEQDIAQARNMFLQAYENGIIDAACFIGLDCLFSLSCEVQSYRKWEKRFRKNCKKMDKDQVLSRAYGQFKLPLSEDSSKVRLQGLCLFWMARIERFRGNRQSAIELYSKANEYGYGRAESELREYKSLVRRLLDF